MRISYSALDTYRTCPKKYQFQEIEKRKVPKSKEALFGTAVHGALAYMFSRDPLFPTLDEVVERFRDAMTRSDAFPEGERSRFLEAGELMIKNFYKKNPPWNFRVVDLESRFEALIEDKKYNKNHILVGIIDRVDRIEAENTYEIIDYKTSRILPSQDSVNRNLQLSVYQLGLLKRWPHLKPDNIRLSLVFLRAGEKLTTTISEETMQKNESTLLEELRNLEKKIEEQDFPPTPSALCNWCGYKPICPAWRHLYEREIKPLPEKAEVDTMINRYAALKNEITERTRELKLLSGEIGAYLTDTGLDRLFGDSIMLARKIQERSSIDFSKIQSDLEAAGIWDAVLVPDPKKLKTLLPSLPEDLKEKVKEAIIIKKFSTIVLNKRK